MALGGGGGGMDTPAMEESRRGGRPVAHRPRDAARARKAMMVGMYWKSEWGGILHPE